MQNLKLDPVPAEATAVRLAFNPRTIILCVSPPPTNLGFNRRALRIISLSKRHMVRPDCPDIGGCATGRGRTVTDPSQATIYANAAAWPAGDPGSNPALGKHGHVTNRSSSPGQPRRSPRLA